MILPCYRGGQEMLMRILVVEDERDLNRVISKRLTRADNSIRFSVKDEGIGIAEDDLKKIWDRFYQVDPARSSSDGMMLTPSPCRTMAMTA